MEPRNEPLIHVEKKPETRASGGTKLKTHHFTERHTKKRQTGPRSLNFGQKYTTTTPYNVFQRTAMCRVSRVNYCLCGSLAQCALSLKRLSAGPGFNPQTRQNKLFQDYWRACLKINFSDTQDGLMVSSIICDR